MDQPEIETARGENPYASPPAIGDDDGEDRIGASIVGIRSVARVFKIVGWFGVILYTPIVLTCVGSLVVTLVGYRIDSPLVLAGASAFNGVILGLAICYVLTGQRISKQDFTVRRRAILLSCLMMIGIPVFTIVGIICYRKIKLYFNDSSALIAANK